MSLPAVSIVVPCYNQGNFLEDTIASVLRSTFQDFEIIIVNDGSTDQNTLNVLARIRHEKIRVIHQENLGLAMARNNGFAVARGEYFLPLDSDDMIAPTMLKESIALLQAHPEVAYAYTDIHYFGDENFILLVPEYNLYKFLWLNLHAHCALIRKQAFLNVGGYVKNKDIHGYDDFELWIHLGLRGWYGKRIPKPLFYYRRHGRTLCHEALEKK